MPSLFSRIIAGEIPCHRLLEDERFFSFLDIRPIHPGHALVVPKHEVDRLFDLDGETLAALLPFARRLALAIEACVPCRRVGLIVAGLEVPHAHLHLVPMQGEGGLDFKNARPADPAALAVLAGKIRAAL